MNPIRKILLGAVVIAYPSDAVAEAVRVDPRK
jgi:hypothetical protein